MIKAAGAWYTIQCAVDDLDNPIIAKILEDNNINKETESVEKFFKFQGVNNVSEFLNQNPTIASFIYSKIKELY